MVLYRGEHPVELNLYSLREHIENLLSLETGIDQLLRCKSKAQVL